MYWEKRWSTWQQAPVLLGQDIWIFIWRLWTYPLYTGQWLYGTNPDVLECHTAGTKISGSQKEVWRP